MKQLNAIDKSLSSHCCDGQTGTYQLGGPIRRVFGHLFVRTTLKRPNREQVFHSWFFFFCFLSKWQTALKCLNICHWKYEWKMSCVRIAILLSLWCLGWESIQNRVCLARNDFNISPLAIVF